MPWPAAVARIRAAITETLSGWHLDDLTEQAVLAGSELATNAVQASGPLIRSGDRIPDIRVCLFTDGQRLLLEVWDQAAGIPAPRHASQAEESGRGLTLVSVITDKWGWHPGRRRRVQRLWAAVVSFITGRRGWHPGSNRQAKCVWAEISIDPAALPARMPAPELSERTSP